MKTFFNLIDKLNACPNEQVQISQEIWQTYGSQKAVLALDMSGFSSTVRREGIIGYLAKIRKMQCLTEPLVIQYQGEIVKYEADNLLAVFDDCQMALEAALAIRNICLDTGVSIGLDYGQILYIAQKDCYGDTVNIAFKLGEDIAQSNEILITENLKNHLHHNNNFQLVRQDISVSGLTFVAYQVIAQ